MHAIESSSAPQPPPPVLFKKLASTRPPAITPSPYVPVTPIVTGTVPGAVTASVTTTTVTVAAASSSTMPSTPATELTPLILQSSLYVILAVRNYYVLTKALLWLLGHTTDPGYLHVVVGVVRASSEAFVMLEHLDELLSALARTCAVKQSDSHPSPPITNACTALFAELLAKYRELPACKEWKEENSAMVPAQARSSSSSSSNNILPHTLAQIRAVVAASGPIPEPVEAILRSSFSLEKIVAGCVQLFTTANTTITDNNNNKLKDGGSRPFARHVALLLSLAEPTAAKLGIALKYNALSYHILRAMCFVFPWSWQS